MRLYVDANSIIYSIEGVADFRLAALAWIDKAESGDGVVVTSRLSRLECRVKPLRDKNAELLERYEVFFARSTVELVELSSVVIELATELRADHNFKVPDALHLASALLSKADVFLTGDKALERCPGLVVEVLGPPT